MSSLNSGWRGEKKQPLATSAFGPPYVACMNINFVEHTHSVNCTPKNHQSTHTQGLKPRRHSLKTFFDFTRVHLLVMVPWWYQFSYSTPPTGCNTLAQLWVANKFCSPHGRTIWLFQTIINIQFEKSVTTGLPGSSENKTGQMQEWDMLGASQRVFEVRCWTRTVCVNQNAVITGEGKEWAHRH